VYEPHSTTSSLHQQCWSASTGNTLTLLFFSKPNALTGEAETSNLLAGTAAIQTTTTFPAEGRVANSPPPPSQSIVVSLTCGLLSPGCGRRRLTARGSLGECERTRTGGERGALGLGSGTGRKKSGQPFRGGRSVIGSITERETLFVARLEGGGSSQGRSRWAEATRIWHGFLPMFLHRQPGSGSGSR
jgi:hypothetical protein